MSFLPPDRRSRRAAGLLILLAAGTAAAVDDVSLQLDRLNWQGWLLEGVEMTLNLSAGSEPVFSARAETALHAASSTLLTGLEAACSAGGVSAEAVECSRGRLSFQHGELGRLDAGFTLAARRGFSDVDFTLDRLGEKENRVRLAGEWRGPAWRLALDSRGLDTGFIYRVAEVLGAGVKGFITGGRLAGRLEARGDASGPRSLDGSIAFDGLGFDTVGGEYAGAGLRGEWQGGFVLGDGGTWRGEHALTLGAGALLTPYALFEPGAASITLKAGLMLDSAVGTLAISPFSYRHPGLLELDGELALALQPAPTLASLDLRSGEVPLGPFFDGYLRPVIGAPLLRDMAVEGAARLDRVILAGGELAVEGRIDGGGLAIEEAGEEKLRLHSLDGDLYWNSARAAEISRLSLGGGALFSGITLGPTQLDLRLEPRGLGLASPASLPVLDGSLEIAGLDVQLDGQGPVVDFDGYITPLSLALFSEAVGLPPFSGRLSGMIPHVRYQDGSLRVGGTILVRVFDGTVLVEDLRLEGVMGVFPVMEADVRMESLDLKMITEAFSFGRITGRLEGRVDGLRLEQWSPVRFDALLKTPDDDTSPHWISQRAVDNISNLGGAGLSGAVSRSMLRMFKDFRYDRLGVRCRLERGVCEMDGVEPADQGYYLVKGGGIPRIDIKGFNRRTDWNSLTQRLKQITEGAPPRIE